MKRILSIIIISIFCVILLFPQVVNTNKPFKGKWDFNKKLLWETESAGDEVFGEIQNIAVSVKGNIFIADTKHSLIFMFDKDGDFLKTFGKKGEGPGELREYFGGDQLHVTKNRIIFVDRALVHYFDLKGNYLNTIQFSPVLRAREFINTDTFLSAPPTVDRRAGDTSKILLYNLKTDKKTIITSFKPFDKATDTQESGGNQVTVGIVIGDITPLMMVRYKDNKIYYGMSNKNEINVCDLNGKHIMKFSNPEKKQNKVSDKFKNDLKAMLGEVPENMLNNIMNGLPKKASFFSAIHVDSKGNIYLFESDPDSETKKIIDIYDKTGKFIYRSSITSSEERTINNILLNNNYLFIDAEDEDGNVVFSKYMINLPE